MKKIIKNLISLLGYKISKKKNFFDFNAHSIDFVLDVGAHKGQFINKVREAGLYKLYENEEQYEYFINLFKSIDYELWDIKPFAFNKSGRLVQFDLIFKNKIFNNNI